MICYANKCEVVEKYIWIKQLKSYLKRSYGDECNIIAVGECSRLNDNYGEIIV
jgi:hypothetical protein